MMRPFRSSPRPAVTRSSPMLIALWLVIAQLFGASSSHSTTSGGSAPAYAAGAAATAQPVGADAAHDRDALVRDAGSDRAIAWVRAAQPLARMAAPRNDAPRSLPPAAAAPSRRLSIDAGFVATVRVRALESSHAIAARGALLSYFATAPPLQG